MCLVLPSAAANLTATVSPSIVAHGDKVFINGTAEGQPNSVAIWILGTNFAIRQTVAVNVDGSFSFKVNQYVTQTMSGQYFVVVQHPEMNGQYDIDWAAPDAYYVYDWSGQTPVSLFKITGPGSLQGFDAEEALVQGINRPAIDDTYTALQFQIVSSSKIGVYKDGFWAIDYNGNYQWDGAQIDKFAGFGQTGSIPVVGDWNGDGITEIGSYKDGFWAIDYNGNHIWDGAQIDKFAAFGQAGYKPVFGDWNGDGKDEIGVEKDGFWAIDYNGNYVWEGAIIDRFAGFGQTGDIPVVGKWS